MADYIQEAGSFVAKELSGKTHIIRKSAKTIKVAGILATGTISLVTTEGLHVTRLGKGSYRLTESEIPLTSDDPNAP
jgi:hypothetical protein